MAPVTGNKVKLTRAQYDQLPIPAKTAFWDYMGEINYGRIQTLGMYMSMEPLVQDRWWANYFNEYTFEDGLGETGYIGGTEEEEEIVFGEDEVRRWCGWFGVENVRI